MTALVLAGVVLVGGLGLLAGIAAASSNAAGTSPTGTGGSAMSPSGNDECYACHGQKPVDGTITVDGQKVPAYIDVNGEKKSIYVDRHIQANSRHGQLACISCHIGFNAGMHPESVTQGWLRTAKIGACGDCHGAEDKMYQQSFHGNLVFTKDAVQGSALRRLPRRAQHHPAGHRRVPQAVRGHVHQVPRRRGDDLPRQLPRQGVRARRREDRRLLRLPRRPQASCRPPIRRAPSPSRTSSRRAPSAIPEPTRTSPPSRCTSIRRTRARRSRSGSSGSPTSC